MDKRQTTAAITRIVLDDVAYVLTLIYVSVMSFGMGLVIAMAVS
jgi:hypothetical protein